MDFEEKLRDIRNIWNNFILKYDYLKRKINYSDDMKSNYVGDLFGYFEDIIGVVLRECDCKSDIDKFSYNISFLQAIYIHQDFIEELLRIFKCRVDKGKLKKDVNYNINREIRNELIGHPIRKIKIPVHDNIENNNRDSRHSTENRKEVVKSSTIFSYNSNIGTIEYLKYDIDNDYKFEKRSFEISEILDRHIIFLNTYLDIILNKLISLLKQFEKQVEKIPNLLERKDFDAIIRFSENNFESIFQLDYLYDKDSLINIYNRRKEHNRYQHFIDVFCSDLYDTALEVKDYIREYSSFSDEQIFTIPEKPLFDDDGLMEISPIENKISYNYELGKLATIRDKRSFEYFGGILRSKCLQNNIVQTELNHMEANIYDQIEYYTSLRLISSELGG